MKRNGLVERCAEMGRSFHRKLEQLRDLPHVGDVRGKGLLAGIEFVEDKGSRTAFPRKQKFAERFADAALEEGLMIWPNVGQANGTDGDLALLAPPFVITEEEIDELARRFARALMSVSEGRQVVGSR
jgi:adenosylmethionine-8-amino-7-oxononanoate aminotransferase